MTPHSYREHAPSPRLARYVECFWSREDREPQGEANILPDGCADILFTSENNTPASLTLIGLMTTPLHLSAASPRFYFGVRFHPGMAAAFAPEAAELTDKVEPLESLWGKLARDLLARLGDSAEVSQKIEIIEQSLRPLNPPDASRRILWQLPSADVPLDRLTSEAGLSERQFRRACLAQSGISPKYLQRILRFRRAVERVRAMVSQPAQPGWAHLAAACGYYDQAHFIREFQEFSGLTPGRFLQSLRPPHALESRA